MQASHPCMFTVDFVFCVTYPHARHCFAPVPFAVLFQSYDLRGKYRFKTARPKIEVTCTGSFHAHGVSIIREGSDCRSCVLGGSEVHEQGEAERLHSSALHQKGMMPP